MPYRLPEVLDLEVPGEQQEPEELRLAQRRPCL